MPASMPTRHGGRFTNRAAIRAREIFSRRTIAPLSSRPIICSVFLPVSIPMVRATAVSALLGMACPPRALQAPNRLCVSLAAGARPVHPIRHARLSEIETELEQLAMDARRAPQRIVNAHPPDECAQIHVDLRSTSKGTGFPTPVPTEAGPMPTHQGLRSDDSDGPEHRWKPSIQQDQEHAIPICVPANESMPQDSLTHTQQLGIPDSTPPESALIAPVFMIDPYWRSAQRATAKLRQNLLGGDFR